MKIQRPHRLFKVLPILLSFVHLRSVSLFFCSRIVSSYNHCNQILPIWGRNDNGTQR